MSNFSDQLGQIKTLISSGTKADKSFAYSTLLQLQELSSDCPASIQTLARSAQCLIHPIVADVHDDDEEIATQALKCLGFMIYHPSTVDAIAVDDVKLVFESLVKLITTTKMKSVCNLGVWCISIQQLSAPLLAAHFHSLLRAVVHSIDNPIGSLSTTFEAIQAVMKLASLLSENMRELSHIWAPPIYRRLLSFDKRERDMSERCLLKITSTILPPPLNLSKALVKDLKEKLLTGMHDMLTNGMKVQTIQAWGWFIRLLGSHALKNRQLINHMLKIPEHTFSYHDSQVQIASQVAWEGLIDALVHPSMILPCETTAAREDNGMQQMGPYKGNSGEIQKSGSSKSIRLIMTPLIGFMSSNCDVSVHLACLNTWCYLLHKLDTSLHDSSVIKLVVEPIFEAVFQFYHDGKSVWARNLCIDLLDDFILAKCKDLDYDSRNQVSHQLSAKSSMNAPSISGNYSWKQYPIKWLPWDLSHLDFHLKMIYILICQASRETVSHDSKNPAGDASLRLFRSVLKGVELEFRKSSNNYNDIMLCLKAILKFLKNICEEVSSDGSDRNDLYHISLQLVEAFSEEIDTTIVGSPLYKVALDIKYIENLQTVTDIKYAKSGVCSIAYMDMVSPMVYLIVLYFCVVVQPTLSAPKTDFILQGLQKYFKFILSSFDPLESLIVTNGLLYKHIGPSCLRMWMAVAEGLEYYINDVKDFSLMKMDSDSKCFVICHLLSYPLVVCSCNQKDFMSAKITSSSEDSHASPQIKVELEQVITLWKSLYGSLCTSLSRCFTIDSFSEELFSILDKCLDKYTSVVACANELELNFKDVDLHLISLYGDVLICILEKFHPSGLDPDGNNKHGCNYKVSSGMKCCWTLAIRYMKLLQTKIGTDSPIGPIVASRVYSALAHFISSLHLKQDILSFFEIISCPLLQWLEGLEMQAESTCDQFQLLWAETLNCLRRSQPTIIYDSAFLKLQAPILEKTLDHPNVSISEQTITFWNCTYGEEIKLDYPQNLLNVLDKLWRNGRINLQKRSRPLQKCHSRLEVATVPPRYRVNATYNNRGSKRVELLENSIGSEHKEMPPQSSLKRKRLELTEHQKEVRRAQQGRERDCGGHGPGVQTYTSVDFSQGNENEDSQENQDIRNPKCILEMRNG